MLIEEDINDKPKLNTLVIPPSPREKRSTDPYISLAEREILYKDNPPPELLHPLLGARGYVTVLASPRGAGKTSIMTAVFSEMTRRGHNVIWWSEDENLDTTQYRFKDYGGDLAKVWLYEPSGVPPPIFEKLHEIIKQTKAVAVMLDTGDKFGARAIEKLPLSWANDQNAVDKVMSALRTLAKDYNVVPVYCTHTRKATCEADKSQPDEDSISGSHKLGANSDYCLTMRGVKNEDGATVASDVWQDRARIRGAEVWKKRIVISSSGEISEGEILERKETRGRKATNKFPERCKQAVRFVGGGEENEHLKTKTALQKYLLGQFGGAYNIWGQVLGYLIKHEVIKMGFSKFVLAQAFTTETALQFLSEKTEERN